MGTIAGCALNQTLLKNLTYLAIKYMSFDMFRRGRCKGVRMGTDGSRWMQMNAKDRIVTGATQNKTKKTQI